MGLALAGLEHRHRRLVGVQYRAVSRTARSASTSGCSWTPQAPTHCARVERGSARPARPKIASCRYSGW